MFGLVAKIIEESIPCRISGDYWHRALTPTGVALLIAAPIAVMAAIGWALELGPNDPTWIALPIIPFALTVLNLGLDDVVKGGRRELRRRLDLTTERIRELAQIARLEIRIAYQIGIETMAEHAAALPDRARREAVHLPQPHPRLPFLTLSPRLLPVPRARACHDKGIGRA